MTNPYVPENPEEWARYDAATERYHELRSPVLTPRSVLEVAARWDALSDIERARERRQARREIAENEALIDVAMRRVATAEEWLTWQQARAKRKPSE
jgi:hypothetical protein